MPLDLKLKPGDPAPQFSATTSDGSAVSLSDFKGKDGELKLVEDYGSFDPEEYRMSGMVGYHYALHKLQEAIKGKLPPEEVKNILK